MDITTVFGTVIASSSLAGCTTEKSMEIKKDLSYKIPPEVSHVTDILEKAGFDAYLVGGCVRDMLMDREPKDWDVTTNAKPEQIIGLFEKTVYENTVFSKRPIICSGLAFVVTSQSLGSLSISISLTQPPTR